MTVTWKCPQATQYADEDTRLVGVAAEPAQKKWDKVAIYDMIMESDRALFRGILAIYDKQTATEKSAFQTIEDNGVGFSGCDSEFLSSLAVQIKQRGTLSDKQKGAGRKCMKKYCNQLAKIANGVI